MENKNEDYIKYNWLEWILDKKKLEEELNNANKIDKEFVDIRTKYENLIKKCNVLKEDNKIFNEVQDKYLDIIKEQRKIIRQLKKQNQRNGE